MADTSDVERKEGDISTEQEEIVGAAEGEEVVSGDGEAVAESGEAEAVAPESEAPPATDGQDKVGDKEEAESPKENGDTNGVTASNGGGDLKRKSLVAEVAEVEVSAEKKAKTVEEVDGPAAEEDAEANGIEAN